MARRIETLPHILQSAGNIASRHAHTDAHALGNLLDLHFIHAMQQECLSALGGQLRDCVARIAIACSPESCRSGVSSNTAKSNSGMDVKCERLPPLPQAIDRQIGRGLEKKGSQEADGCRVIELQQMNVRFLCDFASFLFRADLGRDEAQQRGVVLTEQPLDIDGLGCRGRRGR